MLSPNKSLNWIQMDLNLLKTLYILLEERNISRAADRFFITRSAMSKNLKKLRESLNDPILVRSSDGLIPTEKALKIAESFQEAIIDIEKGLNYILKFEPALAAGHLTIASPETFSIAAIPEFFPLLHSSAPNLQLSSLHLEENYLQCLRSGELDFAIYLKQNYPSDIITHDLFSTRPAVWCRKDHPLTLLKKITLDDILMYPKLAIQLPVVKVDEVINVLGAMNELESEREVIFETSYLMSALMMLCDSDALMISTDYLFNNPVFNNSTTSISLNHITLFDDLNVQFCLLQHERTLNSPLHKWVISMAVKHLNNHHNANRPPQNLE